MATTMTADQFLAAQAESKPQSPVAQPAAFAAAAAPPPAATTVSPPPPPPSRRKKKAGMLWPIVGLGAAVAAIVGGLVLLTGGDEEGPDITEVFAEPVASTGIDPFTPSLVPALGAIPAVPAVDTETVEQVVGLLNPVVGELSAIDFPELDFPGLDVPNPGDGATEVAETVVATVSGAAPGLYGGTEILDACDKEALIGFLEDNLDKATAWADVQGIGVDDIPDFVGSLTDVVLQLDTRVTNHGFRNGNANPINSVLQAGTAVLVDAFGVPRARCFCGNPLQPAIELATDVTVSGTLWPGFDLANSVVVQALEEVLGFYLDDILSGLRFVKPVGAAATPPATTTTPPPTTTTVVLGTGDVQATLRWSGDADLDLHVVDPEGTEIYYENARSPSGGTLDVDMVPDCNAGTNNVENVFWPDGGSVPGVYQAFVVHYEGSACGSTGTYELELRIDGEVAATDRGTLAVGEQSTPISANGG